MSTKTLGEIVRAARWRAGLTQAGLAKKAGVAVSTISRCENDVATPQGLILFRVVEALGLDIDEITSLDSVAS